MGPGIVAVEAGALVHECGGVSAVTAGVDTHTMGYLKRFNSAGVSSRIRSFEHSFFGKRVVQLVETRSFLFEKPNHHDQHGI